MPKLNHYHVKCVTVSTDDTRKNKQENKTGCDVPFLQTTKKLFDVGDEDRHQNYQEAYLEQWKGRIARESFAADSEYFKFSLNPPCEEFMRVPEAGERFYYIPEQHLQWTWREGWLKKNPANAFGDRSPRYTTNYQGQTSTDSKYAFDNGIYKILIR